MTEGLGDHPITEQPPPDPVTTAQPHRRTAFAVLGFVAALAVVGVVAAAIALTHTSKPKPVPHNHATAPDSVMSAVRGVPASTLAAAGTTGLVSAPHPIDDAPLTSGGKPELLFIGAEFCPYCAGERWPMAIALSRFGRLDGVTLTSSSSTDVDPSTATLDFVHATYTSDYVAFVPVENEDGDHHQLQPVTKAQDKIWAKNEPNGARGFPFLDFGNTYILGSPSLDPAILQGLSQQQIAAKLASPTDPVAKTINGSANVLTAAICGMTHNQPAAVCAAPSIVSLRAQLDAPLTQSS